MKKSEQNIGTIISFFATLLLSAYIAFPFFESGIGSPTVIGITLLSILILLVTLFIVILRNFRKDSNLIAIDYLNLGIHRYVLAILMIFYGLPKIFGNFFDYQLFAIDSKMYKVSDFQLAWYFYGRKNWFELFSGLMELIPALFLIPKRTYFIASLILLPVTAQVFILNLFYKIGGITFPAALILLACNLFIIYTQKEKIKQFFKSLNGDLGHTLNLKWKKVIQVGRIVGLFLILCVFILKTKFIWYKSPNEYKSLVGVYTLQEMKKNNVNYTPKNDSLIYKDLYFEKQERWNILRKFNNETEAFIIKLNPEKHTIDLSLNKGGTGDDADIIDTVTTLKGTYKLEHDNLIIKGIQLNDTLELNYKRLNKIQPKKWFW